MTHYLAATALLYVAALLQSISGPQWPLLAGRPDFPLVMVLAWAMLRGSNEGALIGFTGGLLLDSVSHTPFGVNTSLLGLVGYGVGLVETNLYRGSLPFFLGTAVIATFGYHVATFLLLQAMRLAMPPIEQVIWTAVPAAAANALLVAPTFLLCRRMLRALAGWRQMRL